MSLRSPLSRVLGSGSAKEGTEHWWSQRVSAIALIILGVWFLLSFAARDGYSQAHMVAWLQDPVTALMLLIAGPTLAWHSMLGVQVVIEDYVHGPALKVFSLLCNKFVHVVLALAAVLAVLKVFLGEAS